VEVSIRFSHPDRREIKEGSHHQARDQTPKRSSRSPTHKQRISEVPINKRRKGRKPRISHEKRELSDRKGGPGPPRELWAERVGVLYQGMLFRA